MLFPNADSFTHSFKTESISMHCQINQRYPPPVFLARPLFCSHCFVGPTKTSVNRNLILNSRRRILGTATSGSLGSAACRCSLRISIGSRWKGLSMARMRANLHGVFADAGGVVERGFNADPGGCAGCDSGPTADKTHGGSWIPIVDAWPIVLGKASVWTSESWQVAPRSDVAEPAKSNRGFRSFPRVPSAEQ